MSISRDMIYVLAAVVLAGIGSGVLRVSQNRTSRLHLLLRAISRVVVVLGFVLAGTVFWWYLSDSPRFLHAPEFYLAAAFLGGSMLWWFRPLGAQARRRGMVQFGYPVLLMVLVSGLQLAAYQIQRGKSHSLHTALEAAEGQLAPEIQFLDVSGAPRRLSEFTGKVVLLNFWATTCGPCVHEMPGLSELQSKHKARGFVLVYLSSEEPDILARFFRGRNLDGIHGRLVPQYPVSAFYASGKAWPISFLISRSGVVRDVWLGAPPLDYAEKKIEQEL
jgi:thiol-disulfide isomerase/thioredoxin